MVNITVVLYIKEGEYGMLKQWNEPKSQITSLEGQTGWGQQPLGKALNVVVEATFHLLKQRLDGFMVAWINKNLVRVLYH